MSEKEKTTVMNFIDTENHDSTRNPTATTDRGETFQSTVGHGRQFLRVDSRHAESHAILAQQYHERGEFEQAEKYYSQAVEQNPNLLGAWFGLGILLQHRFALPEARVAYQRVVELKPDFADAWNRLGHVHFDLAEPAAAITCYSRAMELSPDDPHPRCDRALAYLLSGDDERGWREYESRWELPGHQPPQFLQPRWDGTPLNGRTIFLDWEQGFGDTLLFARFAALVQQQGGQVILRCQKPLARILNRTPGINRLIANGEELPHFDVHAPLMSVPFLINLKIKSLPACVPYISPDPALLDLWEQKLSGYQGLRIGISWKGNPGYQRDQFRSIPLATFTPLAAIPDVQLFSLQKNADEENTPFPLINFGEELDNQHGPFMDTAAIMRNLDLVITADTSIGHLAGALGVPVCVLQCALPEWRWQLDPTRTPWYPTMRLYRQQLLGDWQAVFEKLVTDVNGLLQKRTFSSQQQQRGS
jgi:tetratricopeptide (TPR) repeat protein